MGGIEFRCARSRTALPSGVVVVADWDREAATFDLEPDHGLLDVEVRRAWGGLLAEHLPAAPARVVDIGCGTGSLSLLIGELGHAVSGMDFSSQMLARARSKACAADTALGLVRGDAAFPSFRPATLDAVVVRHVLWALPDVDRALHDWSRLLRPAGVLLLIEGQWSTGAGLAAVQVVEALHRMSRRAAVHELTDQRLWGRAVDDDRYLVVSRS